MAADSITIELCSPQMTPLELSADEVVIPGAEGVMTIMPGHTLVLTTLKCGVLIVTKGETKTFFAIHGGFAEIANDRIAILADQLEQASDIDSARAQASKVRATERLEKVKPETNVQRAQASLARALARLQVHHGEL